MECKGSLVHGLIASKTIWMGALWEIWAFRLEDPGRKQERMDKIVNIYSQG